MKRPFDYMILAILLSFVATSSFAKEVAGSGVTTLSVKVGGHRVRVEVKTEQIDIGLPSDRVPEARTNSCTYSRYPCSLVQRVDIYVDSKKIFVPRSSYADLSDLRNITFSSQRTGALVLVLNGGDAAESYTVKLFFNGEHIYRRLLYPSGTTVEPTEDSRYKLLDVN